MFFFHVSEREYDTCPEQVYRECYVRLRACVVPFFFALRSGVRFVHEHDDTFHRQDISYSPTRTFGIGISYRFGNLKDAIKKVKRGIKNDDVKALESGS